MHAPKAPKAPKSRKKQPSKSTKRYKQTKIKKYAQKTSNGKKVTYSLICVFVIAKKKIHKSPYNVNVLKIPMAPQLGSCKHTYTYMNRVVGTRIKIS